MTSDGALVPARATFDLHALALHIHVLGSTLDVSAGDVLRMGAGLLCLAILWWPFVVAAIAGTWLVFVKAGRPGWSCLVPGYNAVQFLRVAKLPGWACVLFLVPGVNVVLFVVACARLARAFRKGPRFAAGLVLFPPVCMTVLGLGCARYRRFEVLAGAGRDDVDLVRSARAAPSLPLSSIQFPGRKGVDPVRGRSGARAAAIDGLGQIDHEGGAGPLVRAVRRPLHLV